MSTIKHCIERINRMKTSNKNTQIAMAIWGTDDVITRAKEREIKITPEQANDIVRTIDQKQDCSIGINWTVIDYYLDEIEK